MAKFEDGSYSSAPGIALIAKVLAGRCKMNYTRAAVGKGYLGEDESPKTALEPAGYVMDAMIAAVTNPVNGECQVTVQINSADVETGFYVTSVVLYAEDPDEGEVPYTYLFLENGPEWIRPASSVVGKLATFDMIVAVGDVDKVTASIDAGALVSYGELAKIIRGIAAGAAQKDLVIPASGWLPDTDTDGAFDWMMDIAGMDIEESMIPLLTVKLASLDEAANCGLCQVSRTLPGVLRVYAKAVPTSAIAASLTLLETEQQLGNGLSASAAVAQLEITIPADGWEDSDTRGVYIDIHDPSIEAELVPLLTVLPECLGAAVDCGLSTYAMTFNGKLRVYAEQPPANDITASLALLGVVHNIDDKLPSEGGGAYVQVTATETRLGSVKIGDGLEVAPDGTVSVSKASDKEFEDMLSRVYPGKSET